jgi:hypothetical protein
MPIEWHPDHQDVLFRKTNDERDAERFMAHGAPDGLVAEVYRESEGSPWSWYVSGIGPDAEWHGAQYELVAEAMRACEEFVADWPPEEKEAVTKEAEPEVPPTPPVQGMAQLAAALAKAQGQIRSAPKDAKNPDFKSSYATLASVWDVCRGPLSSNGLAVVQLCQTHSNEGKVYVTVETRLLHAGGGSLGSTMKIPVAKPDAQGIGSALTYGRRYGLAAMVGVAPDDDDDGNAAAQQPPHRGGRR